MNYSSRFFLYAPFVMFLSLAAAVMTYWWIAAAALNKQLEASKGHEIMPGVTLSYASKRIAGFPFRLDTILDDVRLEVATSNGPAIWRTEHFASHALTYGRDQTIYEAAGRQELSWRDNDGAHDFVFVPGSLRASAIAVGGKLSRFDLDIIEVASPELGAGRIQLHLRRDPASDALDLFVSGDIIHLAPDLQAGFGDTISKLRLAATLKPGSPFGPLLAGTSDWRRATENWRTHGGAFGIDQCEIKWGKVSATCHGAVTLDDAHRLNGQIALNVSGTVALMVSNIRLPKLANALAGFTTLYLPPADGVLAAPIGLKGGVVSMGNQPAGYIGRLY